MMFNNNIFNGGKSFSDAQKEMAISTIFAGLPLPAQFKNRLLDTTSMVEFKKLAHQILLDIAEKGTTEILVPQNDKKENQLE